MADLTMSQFASKDDLIAAQAVRIAEVDAERHHHGIRNASAVRTLHALGGTDAWQPPAEQGKCLHQIAEPAATPFMHGIADGCGNAYFEEGCVAPEANDLQPEVDGLNSRLDEDEAPYRVVALYAHPAQLSAVQTTKVVGALEMLENGALNVAENAKNRGDDYGVGYAQAMAKMARDTLDVLSAPAHPAEGVPAQAAQPSDALIETVDAWFAENTGLGGCSDKDVAELAAIFATHPTQQGLDAEAKRRLEIGRAVERACKDLPEGAGITISLERGAGMVEMIDWDGNEFDHFDEIEDFAERINAATDGAIAAIAAQAKQGGAA